MRWLQRSWVRLIVAAGPILAFLTAIALAVAPLQLDPLLAALLAAAGAAAIYVGYVRLVEQRPIVELGSAGALGELGRGAAIGALLFTAVIAVLVVSGHASVASAGAWTGAARMLGAAAAAAVTEEILIRAVLFRLIERGLGTWIALIVSAAIFGLLHMFNPGATVTSTLAIALEAGVLLAAAFVLTRRLWMAMGLHFAWNFTEGGVFGAAVSGGTVRGVFTTSLHGHPLITGGSFGPEASLVAVVLCLTVGVAALALAHRRGRFVPPYWHRASPAATAAAA